MTATLTVAATAPVAAELDPREARAQFLFDLDMAELTVTIPQADAPAGIQRY